MTAITGKEASKLPKRKYDRLLVKHKKEVS